MTSCPGCGSTEYVSNLIDETPYVEAAQYAPELRHFGNLQLAEGLLRALARVRITNFLRCHWLCLICGVKFDG